MFLLLRFPARGTCRPYGGGGGRHRLPSRLRYSSTRPASVKTSFSVGLGSLRPKTRCLARAPAGHHISRWVASSGTPSSAVVQPDSVTVRPQHSRVTSPQAGHGHALLSAEVHLVPQFEAGRIDYLVVLRVSVAPSPLAVRVLFEASSCRVVVDRHPVLGQGGCQSSRLIRRLIFPYACVFWHPLWVHPIPLPDGPDS